MVGLVTFATLLLLIALTAIGGLEFALLVRLVTRSREIKLVNLIALRPTVTPVTLIVTRRPVTPLAVLAGTPPNRMVVVNLTVMIPIVMPVLVLLTVLTVILAILQMRGIVSLVVLP